MSSDSSPIQERQVGDYLIQDILGDGGFAKVYLGMHIPTKERVAIKIIDKEELFSEEINKKRLFLEISILKKVRHKNIIKLYEIMETPATLYLVMEYCNNGELFDYIVSKDKLNEKQACVFYQEIIDALSYLHSINIVHRDVKPENILLNTINRKINCKLIDFGISRTFEKNELIETPCGTASYAPPEMHNGERYNPILSDVWSSGVLLYSMVCGFLPFNEEDEYINIKNIIQGNYEFPEDEGLSSEVIDLIRHLLDINTSTRYNLEQIRQHPWFNLIPPISRPGIIIGYHKIPIDPKILKQCIEFGYDKDKVIESVEKNRYDKNSAVYYILLKKFEIQGIESISDLYSEKYLEYINDRNNLLTEEEISDLKNEMEKIENEENIKDLNKEFEEEKEDKSFERIYSEKSLEEINNDSDSMKSLKEIEPNQDKNKLTLISDDEKEEQKEENIKNYNTEEINILKSNLYNEINSSNIDSNKYEDAINKIDNKEEINNIEIQGNEKEKEIKVEDNDIIGKKFEEKKERSDIKREEILNKIKEKIKKEKEMGENKEAQKENINKENIEIQENKENYNDNKENIEIQENKENNNNDNKENQKEMKEEKKENKEENKVKIEEREEEKKKKYQDKKKEKLVRSYGINIKKSNINKKDLSLKLRPFNSLIQESKTKELLNIEEPENIHKEILNSSFTIKITDKIKENILKMKNPKNKDKMTNIKILKALNELNTKKVKNEKKNREKKVKFQKDEDNILNKGNKIEHTIIKNRNASVQLRRKRIKEEEKEKEIEKENISKKNIHHSLRKVNKDKQYIKSKKYFSIKNNINLINNNNPKKSLRFSKRTEIRPKEKNDNNNSKNNINKDGKKSNIKISKQNLQSNKSLKEPKKTRHIYLKSETNISVKSEKINSKNNMRKTINYKSRNTEKAKGINNTTSININSRNIKKSNFYIKQKTLNYSQVDKKNKDQKQKLTIENYHTHTQNLPKNVKKINKMNVREKILQSYNTNDVTNNKRNNSVEFRKNKIKNNRENNIRNNSIEFRRKRNNNNEVNNGRNNSIELRKSKIKNTEENLINNKLKITKHNTNRSKKEKTRNNETIELRKKLGASIKNKLDLTNYFEKIDKNKINENFPNTERNQKKEKIKIDKNSSYRGPLGIKNLIISDSIEFIQDKIINSLRLNQIKFWKINPFKFSCCTKNMDKFFVEICFVSDLVTYKNSIRKNDNEEEVNEDGEEEINSGKKYLFYIKIMLSKENNDIPHCKLLEKVIDAIQKKS